MTIQVNPLVSPRIVTVPLTDGDSITVQSLVNQIRQWEQTVEALPYDKLLSASGKEDLGGNILVGITAKLENTKLMFEARGTATTCYVGGGNLVAVNASGVSMFPIEPSTNVTVQLTKSSSATLLNQETMASDLAFIKQVEQGRWKIVNNQMIFYDLDGITPIRTFALKDKAGNPAEQSIYERVPV